MKDYPFEVRPLTIEEGGGYFISYPDFDMCVSDGETIEEAIAEHHHTKDLLGRVYEYFLGEFANAE